MLNDPELDKMIIYGLAGVCLVLLLAVIFLAVKKNVYYVDEDGVEVPSPKAVRKVRKVRKPKSRPEPQPEPQPEPEPEPEPAAVPVTEPEPEPVPAAEPEVLPVYEPVPEPVYAAAEEEEKPEETPVPVFAADPEPEEPEEEEPEYVPEEEPLPVLDDDEDDDIELMTFTSSNSGIYNPEDGFPVLDDDSSVSREITLDEEELSAPEVPAVVLPKAIGLVVTVTVGGQSQTHEIDRLPCLIGREQTSCDLVISEPAVSRRHARFYSTEEGLFIEDVSEHNGTYLNGTKLPSLGSAPLSENDRISLGRAEIAVVRILY